MKKNQIYLNVNQILKKVNQTLMAFPALLVTLSFLSVAVSAKSPKDAFPDGTPVPDWFHHSDIVPLKEMGRQYVITDYGVNGDSTAVQTVQIQKVIDEAAQNGGGVIIIPRGTFLTGSLFFKPRTHLYLEEGATLKGSDNISDFQIIDTRLEGQSIRYFAALVNAIGVDGFTISGKGTINGNGLRYWQSFWLRRKVNPNCTNLEELRPRLLYIAECRNIQLSGVSLVNSPFWTTHLYRCENAQLLGLRIFAPAQPVKAPSSDAVDMDVCRNVLIKGCYVSVNDDAIVFKGGKGPDAQQDKRNGMNEFIIVEDCHFGFCHSAMTVGSESLHTRNVLFRRCTVDGALRLLWLKMRPDTPQRYEYISVSDITGSAEAFICVKPWTQFFDLKGGKTYIKSYGENVSMSNIRMKCGTAFDIQRSDDQYELKDFNFSNITLTAEKAGNVRDAVTGCKMTDVLINGEKY